MTPDPLREIYRTGAAANRWPYPSHVYIVRIGRPLHEEIETLDDFRRYLLWFAPLLLLGASAVGYWLSRRALAPVDALARTARTISGHNLSSRLEQLHTGDELQRLSDTLN